MAGPEVFQYRKISPGAAAALERVGKRFGTWAREVAARTVANDHPALMTEGGAYAFNLILRETGDTLCFLVCNELVPNGEESSTGLWLSTPKEEDAEKLRLLELARDRPEAREIFGMGMDDEELDEQIEDLRILSDD